MDDFNPRFDRLEQAVDAIAIEVERVSEGQRFVTKILAERPATDAQSLALGAGPASRFAYTTARESDRIVDLRAAMSYARQW